MRIYRWFRRATNLLSALSDFGTFMVAIIAVVLFFSRDLQIENFRLLNEKTDLIGDKARLDSDVKLLGEQRARAEDELGRTKTSLADVTGRLMTMSEEARRQQGEVNDYASSAAKLKATNTALQTDNAITVLSTKKLADRLLPTLLVSYLPRLHPTVGEALSGAEYDFLYDPDDSGFRISTEGEPAVFRFVTLTKEDMNRSHSPENTRCRLDDDYILIGYVQEWPKPENMTMRLLNLDRDFVFRHLCRYLGNLTDVGTLSSRKSTTMPLFRFLQRDSSSLMIQFFAGRAGGFSYEAIREHTFWMEMFGFLYQQEMRRFDLSTVEEKTALLELGATVSYSYENVFDDIRKNSADELKGAGFSAFSDQARDFETKWEEYLKQASVPVGTERRPLFENGEAVAFLPRLKSEEIESDAFLTDWDAVRSFNANLNCHAMMFAIKGGYIAETVLPEYGACMSIEMGSNAAGVIEKEGILGEPK
jgi:hypothetical protein